MASAAHRDSVASEYESGYAIVFGIGAAAAGRGTARPAPRRSTRSCRFTCGCLASRPDTLIARKAGAAAAQAVSAGAREVLDGTRSLADFDASLRGPDHRLNPGTTADLVAATLLVALLTGMKLP